MANTANTDEIRQRLGQENAGFQRLARKHNEYEEQLEQLQVRRYLSDEDKLNQVKLKKLKLAVRDHMEQLVRQASG